MYVLDTNMMSTLGWEDSPKAMRIQKRLSGLREDEFATTIISFEEFTRGWLAVLARSKKLKEQIETYRRLGRQLHLFCCTKLLDFDEHAAIELKRLKKQHPRLGSMDLKIAAITLSHHGILVTANLRDFRQIDGLAIEDWTRLDDRQ